MSGDSPAEKTAKLHTEDGSLTAADYLEAQLQLEKDAREAMPYEPDTCTYPQTLRQLVFACLTCRKDNANTDVGVCYLCLIQCHSTHELVQLFSRRNFVCDCGTSRMHAGKACAIRTCQTGGNLGLSKTKIPHMRSGSFSSTIASSRPFSKLDLPPASDIESLGNIYNPNFAGRFCSCAVLYNPIQETQTMHQCFLGDVCGEEWFHQECILGYKPGTFQKKAFVGSGENKRDEFPHSDIDAASETAAKVASETGGNNDEDDGETAVPHFPDLDSFGEFVCWHCVAKHRDAFEELSRYKDIVVTRRPHFANVPSSEAWASLNDKTENPSDEPPAKKQKTGNNLQDYDVPFSVFLAENSHLRLLLLRELLSPTSPLRKLLTNFDFLVCEDPIYQPVEEDVASTQVSEGSLYDLGSTALLSLPIPQALEGLQAYDTMKEKLRGFFKDFVDQKKVVTEEEVRDFFGKMKEK